MIKNIPNSLSLARICSIPLIICLVVQRTPNCSWVATGLLIFAGITDYLDGLWARRNQNETALGTFLDPLADKVLLLSVLVTLVGLENSTWILVVGAIVILSHEVSVSAILGIAASEHRIMKTPRSNQARLVLQFLALTVLLVADSMGSEKVQSFGLVLLILAALFSIFSAVEYSVQFAQHGV